MATHSGNCIKCQTWRRSLHRDHILPRWKGGGDESENIQYLCANCHEDKTAEDMKGHPVSEEQKQAHSKRMTGRTLTEEHRKKLGDSHRGKQYRKWSAERRAAHSIRQQGAWTQERRLAHSLSAKKAWSTFNELTPEEKVANRLQRSEEKLAKLKAQLDAQEMS